MVETIETIDKKAWCVDKLTLNFFANPNVTEPVQSLEQFTNFVNTICPELDPGVPNGVIVTSCFHTGFFLIKTLRPLADAAFNTESNDAILDDFDKYIDDFCV